VPSIPLPENASLEHLKKQAKLVQQLVGSGDSGALDLIREFQPKFADTAPGIRLVGFKRSDAQLVVARLYGFASWAKLRDHLGLLDDFTRPDPADADSRDDVERFVALACVSYNGDHDPHARIELARTMVHAKRRSRNNVRRSNRGERQPSRDDRTHRAGAHDRERAVRPERLASVAVLLLLSPRSVRP